MKISSDCYMFITNIFADFIILVTLLLEIWSRIKHIKYIIAYILFLVITNSYLIVWRYLRYIVYN